jgi:hypothetical protein
MHDQLASLPPSSPPPMMLEPIRGRNHNILPSDLYDPVTYQESPGELVTGAESTAYSKWFSTDGNFSWEKCHILDYDEEQSRYLIEWETGSTKYVSRLNLRHNADDQSEYTKRIADADILRKRAEQIMLFHSEVANIQCDESHPVMLMTKYILKYLQGVTWKVSSGNYRNSAKYRALAPSDRFKPKTWKQMKTHCKIEDFFE